MLFNSFHFLLFFPLVTAGYYLLPHRARWAWLLAASCYFYMVFRPVYILILFFTILVDYFAGLGIAAARGSRRKHYLFASIGANIGILAFFKYYNFFAANITVASHWFGVPYTTPFLDIILPLGLSFHTFQSLAYTVEVYRGNQQAEKHLGIFALYVMFYPQLVAGPIERPQAMLHQFHERHHFDYLQVTDGLKLMLWGMMKKVVIADRLAPFVNQVYNDPTRYDHGISFVVATVFFAFQIYCDFSGYSDIAIGSAQVMGFTLMRNFDKPYLSTSIAEFWRRWHISLSGWFRDYVYIPLGGRRRGHLRTYINLLVTFLLSGLWHGASWTYVIWGGLNGVYLVGEQIMTAIRGGSRPKTEPHWRVITWAITFALICLSWIFFRARTPSEAWYILTHLTAGWSTLPTDLQTLTFIRLNVLMLQDYSEFVIALVALSILFIVEYAQRSRSIRKTLAHQPTWIRWSVYYAAATVVVFFGSFNSSQEFIYFQF